MIFRNFVDMYIQSYQKLIVWQRAKELALFVYRITKCFPGDERYNLVSQMRRSSYSVMANIAEGCDRKTPKDQSRFYVIAHASLTETACGLDLSRSLGFIDKSALEKGFELINKTGYLLKKLRDSSQKNP
jgi:four helix bundle protein